MAKIKFGMMMTDASGKLGGQVFSKNRGGAYVRTKVTPLNPQTTAQSVVRGIFASISSLWSGITQADRDTFNSFVNDYARTDVFGDLRNPSGKALFQRLNQNLEISGQAQITTCVAPIPVPFANVSSVDADVSATSFDVVTTGDTRTCKVVIWATPQLTAGTTFVKNRLRVLEVFDGGEAETFDIQTSYLAKYGQVQVGSNVFIGVRVINDNGQASPLEVVRATIVA
jgi:hypothetical protein